MKRLIALLLALMLVLSMAACSDDDDEDTDDEADDVAEDTVDDEDDEPADADDDDEDGSSADTSGADRNGDGVVRIAYSTIAYSIAVMPQVLQDNIEELVEAEGWEFVSLAAEGDVELQGEQVSQLLAQDPDYFVMFPGEPTLAADWAEEIAEAGVPLICVGTDVAGVDDDTPNENCVAYVGPDNYLMAYAMGEALIENNGADAGLKIVQISGVPAQSDMIQRAEGFADSIADTNYELLGDIEWAYSSRADAQGIMENFISTYGDDIDVLIGYDDDLTLGGVSALQEAGMTDVQVYSITGQIEAMEAIAEGTMTLTSFTPTANTAAKVVEVLKTLMDGGTVSDYFQYTEVPQITIDNVDQFEGEF